MPGTVKSELLPDADRSHKCDCQEKVSWKRNLPLDKSHFITETGSGTVFSNNNFSIIIVRDKRTIFPFPEQINLCNIQHIFFPFCLLFSKAKRDFNGFCQITNFGAVGILQSLPFFFF